MRPLLAAVLLWGCASDGGHAGADSAVLADVADDLSRYDAEAEASAGDGGPGPRPGSWMQVVEAFEFSAERVCDLDGDGVLDNAIADLGPAVATLFTMALNTLVLGRVDDIRRFCVHSPLIDDLTVPDDPSFRLIVINAEDVDDPDDPTDDFSGEEPFWAEWKSVDECGEPAFAFEGASLDAGMVSASGGAMPIPISDPPVRIGGAVLDGTVAPGAATSALRLCGYLSIGEVGAVPSMATSGDQSLLETLLVGGVALGVPTIPGLNANVDLDGDGLERFVLDDDGHIVSCVDGDTSIIAGRDCWADPRMADGFAVVVLFDTVGAVFAGLEPHWELNFDEPCESPPDPSLWDPS